MRLADLEDRLRLVGEPSTGYVGSCPACSGANFLVLRVVGRQAVVSCVAGCNLSEILAGTGRVDRYAPERGLPALTFEDLDALDDVEAGPSASGDCYASQVLTRSGLASLPDPEPLISDTLDRHTLALLAGYHGTGKSFVALDWSACVATGEPWLGREVRQGRVLYVVGEGAYGLHARLSAWEESQGVEIPDDGLHVYPGAVQLARSTPRDRRAFLDFVRNGEYALVVLDTLARCAVGLDENSASDMGVLVDAAEDVKRATSGTVLFVHHTGKDRATVRGSSALEAAMDTVYATEGDPAFTTLKRTKRKDGRTFDEHHLRLREVGSSAVLRPLDEDETPEQPDLLERAFRVIRTSFGDRLATRSELVRVLVDNGVSRPSAYRKVRDLDTMEVLVYASTPGDRTVRYRLDLSAAKTAGLPLDPIGISPGISLREVE